MFSGAQCGISRNVEHAFHDIRLIIEHILTLQDVYLFPPKIALLYQELIYVYASR